MSAQAIKAQAQSKKSGSAAYYVHTIIYLSIMFGFGQLTPIEPLTPMGMNLAGIFLGALYGWVFADIICPSLVGLLALILVGDMQPVMLLNKSFGDPIVAMMFFIFIFCACVSHHGISKFISMWFITRKVVAGKPWLFTFSLLGSVLILGGLTSASPAILVGWGILYGIFDMCGYKKGESYPTMMIFGVVFAAQIGMSLVPFKQVPLVILSAYETMSGIGIDYAKYMLIAICCSVVSLTLFILVGKYIFKPDMSKLENLAPSRLAGENSLHLDKVQKLVMFFLLALVALLLLPNFLPADFFLSKFLKGIGNTGICILLVTLMCIIKVDGKRLLNFKPMVDSGVAWNVMLLLALVQPLSAAMAMKESGISAFLIMVVDPILGGSSPLVFAICVSLVAVSLTQLMNNAALGVAMLPIIYSYCTAANIGPELPLILLVISVHLAFITPAASTSAALLHGNDWSDTKSIWKTVPLVVLLSWVAVVAITVALSKIIF